MVYEGAVASIKRQYPTLGTLAVGMITLNG
jgi:hypothetical protein